METTEKLTVTENLLPIILKAPYDKENGIFQIQNDKNTNEELILSI